MARGIAFVTVSLLVVLVAAVAALADGLPVLGVDVGTVGVVSRPGDARYVALTAGTGTVVARVRPDGGQVVRFRLLRGRFTIPAVAYDGSAGGLSADGRSLVLIEPRTSFPRATTSLAVLDAHSLASVRRIRLRGDFSFDAISPRGSLVYLIPYVDRNDPNRYLVRAYDVRRRQLLPKPIVDPREPDEQMRGRPLTRAASANGRWAYTLYDGAGRTPFVHALDTSSVSARCVDLEMLRGRNLSALRFSVDANAHRLRIGPRPLVSIDTSTFRVVAMR